jgi:hypothetical protein
MGNFQEKIVYLPYSITFQFSGGLHYVGDSWKGGYGLQ